MTSRMVTLHPRWPKFVPRSEPVDPRWAQVGAKSGPVPFDRLHVALGLPKLTVRWIRKSPSRHHYSLICAEVGPKMDEVGPKTAQSRTDMAPVELKLATSWPEDCMKADISHECIKHTNSLGKTMIYYIPHGQFASKMAQIRAKI